MSLPRSWETVRLGAIPKLNSSGATSRTPKEETSLASGAAVRSGRNAISSIAAPTASTNTRLTTSAGAVASVKPS